MKTGTQSPVRAGTAVTAIIGLLPYIRDFFVVACLTGALAAVWFAIRKIHERPSFQEGARLAFLSAFYGLLLASTIYDLVWQVFHYQLWRIQNIDRMMTLCAGMIHDAFQPSVWIMITLQIVIAAICAGAIGAPSGILAVKLFQGYGAGNRENTI